MSEQGAAPALGGQQADTQEASAPDAQGVDLAPVLEQLAAQQGTLEELRTSFQQRPQEQQEQEQPGDEPTLDFPWLDEEQGVFDPEQMKQGFQEAVRQAVADAQQAPMAEIQRMRQEQEFDRLAEEYPEMTDEATFKGVVKSAGDLASQMMRESGITQEQAQALVNSPAFLRTVYRSAKAGEAAAGETPANAQAAHVEGGSGPRPAAQEENPLAAVFAPGQNKIAW